MVQQRKDATGDCSSCYFIWNSFVVVMPIPRQNKVKRSPMAVSYSQVQHGTVSIVRKSELSERQAEGLGLSILVLTLAASRLDIGWMASFRSSGGKKFGC